MFRLSVCRTFLMTGLVFSALSPISAIAAPYDGPVPTEAETLSSSFRSASKGVLPAVVTVRPIFTTMVPAMNALPSRSDRPRFGLVAPFGDRNELAGSGVVIDRVKGHVLTNAHVVEGTERVVVVLPDGRERVVKSILRDRRSDLALLLIDTKDLKQAIWGRSEPLEIGDWVLAIGQPFGLAGTVTAGIISGKGRGGGGLAYEDMIQTDASINPGNSGGPLINLKGEIIGINTAIRSVRGAFEGVGLAIPAERARRIASDLATQGSVQRAQIGISIHPIGLDMTDKLDYPGALVVNQVVAGSPADLAGVKANEILLEIEGKPIRGVGGLFSEVEFATVGKPLRLKVRNIAGDLREVQVVPTARLEEPPASGPPSLDANADADPRLSKAFPEIGLNLAELPYQGLRELQSPSRRRGLSVLKVEPESPAAKAGVPQGALLFEIGEEQVDTLEAVRRAIRFRVEEGNLTLSFHLDNGPARTVILNLQDPGEAPRAKRAVNPEEKAIPLTVDPEDKKDPL